MRRALAIATLGIVAVGACSLVEPRAGILLPQCAGEAGAPSAGYTYAPAAAAPRGAAPVVTCTLDAGDTCERCENERCCDARIGCYNDALCMCADSKLDECLEDLEDGGAPAAVQKCWNDFTAIGAIEQTLAACLRASCKDACAIP